MKIACRNCQQTLLVQKCGCGRSYILSKAHLEDRKREQGDGPLEEAERAGVKANLCDFCRSKAAGDKPFSSLNFGLRQKTCPSCHAETLSYYELH